MRTALRSLAVLVGLAVLGGAAVAWFADATKLRVRENRHAAETLVLRELLGFEIDAASGGDVLLCERNLLVLRGDGRGYGGEFRLAVALEEAAPAGTTVKGVRIIDHAETPGFADILKAGSTWLDSFRHGEVDAVTGATVTSQAVIAAVDRALQRAAKEGMCVP